MMMLSYGLLIDEVVTAGIAGERVGAPLERHGFALVVRVDVGRTIEELQAPSSGSLPVLVVIGPSIADAIGVAQVVHRAAPLASLLFVVEGESETLTRQLASPLSMVGTDWQLQGLSSDRLANAVAAAAQRGRRRQQLRSTLDRINAHLSNRPVFDPSDLRRYTISHSFLASILANAQDAIIATNDAGIIVTWNRAAEPILGLSAGDAVGRPLAEVCEGEWPEHITAMMHQPSRLHERSAHRELQCLRPDGRSVHVEVSLSVVRTEASEPIGWVAIGRDIEERKRLAAERAGLERQVLHAQKLESLGVLAGGIAHDFNNLLTGVLGHTELALQEVVATSHVGESLCNIRKSAVRAADLCQQMLAYSGRGRFVIEPIDLNTVIDGMEQLLYSSIAKTVTVRKHLAADLPATDGDVTQIRQVIMNVMTNAAEAIGDAEGIVTMRTAVIDTPPLGGMPSPAVSNLPRTWSWRSPTTGSVWTKRPWSASSIPSSRPSSRAAAWAWRPCRGSCEVMAVRSKCAVAPELVPFSLCTFRVPMNGRPRQNQSWHHGCRLCRARVRYSLSTMKRACAHWRATYSREPVTQCLRPVMGGRGWQPSAIDTTRYPSCSSISPCRRSLGST
jgi:PAS domain S-box-containing protein